MRRSTEFCEERTPGAKPQAPKPTRSERAEESASYTSATIETVPARLLWPLLDVRAVLSRRWKMLPAGASDEQKAAARKTLDDLWSGTLKAGVWQPKMVSGAFAARLQGTALQVLDPALHRQLSVLQFSPAFARSLRAQFGAREFTVGLQLVTVGPRAVEKGRRFAKAGQIHDQYLLHGLAAELTEALARLAQVRLQARLGCANSRRISPGYPAWPELAEQAKLFRLLRPGRIGVRLTDGRQLAPEYSTSAIVIPT